MPPSLISCNELNSNMHHLWLSDGTECQPHLKSDRLIDKQKQGHNGYNDSVSYDGCRARYTLIELKEQRI